MPQTVLDDVVPASPPAKTRTRRPPPAPLTLPADGDGWLVDKQVCAVLSIGRSTLWRWVREGRIARPVRIGRMTRWRISDVRALLNGSDSER